MLTLAYSRKLADPPAMDVCVCVCVDGGAYFIIIFFFFFWCFVGKRKCSSYGFTLGFLPSFSYILYVYPFIFRLQNSKTSKNWCSRFFVVVFLFSSVCV